MRGGANRFGNFRRKPLPDGVPSGLSAARAAARACSSRQRGNIVCSNRGGNHAVIATGLFGTTRRRCLAVVRGNGGSVADPWALDITRSDRRQPSDAHVTDWHLLGSKLGCRRSATHLRAAVLYLADILREESLVGGSVVGNASTLTIRMRLENVLDLYCRPPI